MRKVLSCHLISILLVILFSGCSGSSEATLDPGTITSAAGGTDLQISGTMENPGKLSDPDELKYLISPRFDLCGDEIDGIIKTQVGMDDSARFGFIDSAGNTISDPVYEDTLNYIGASSASSGFSEGMAPVKKSGKWGYIDMKGQAVIDFRFDSAALFSEGLAQIGINGKHGYVDKKGKVVIKPDFESASEFHHDVAVVQKGLKYGFINKTGEWIAEPEYDSVDFGRWDYSWESSGILQIGKEELKGLARTENGKVKVIVEPKYFKIYPNSGGEARFVILKKGPDGVYEGNNIIEGFMDGDGNEILKWDSSKGLNYEYMKEGMRQVKNEEGKWGFVDESFRQAVPFKYDDTGPFTDGWALVEVNGKTGLIDKEGKELLPPVYDVVVPDKPSGYIIVGAKGRKHMISADTLETISREYDDIGGGHEVLPVTEKGKIGFVDKKGEELVSPQYDECYFYTFWEENQWVKKNGRWIYVDSHGVQQFAGSYEEVNPLTGLYTSVKNGGKWGVIDITGKTVIPFDFDKAFIQAGGLVKVLKDGKYGFINLKTIRADN